MEVGGEAEQAGKNQEAGGILGVELALGRKKQLQLQAPRFPGWQCADSTQVL